MEQNSTEKNGIKKSEYNLLYKLGGLASFLAALLYLFQLLFTKWRVYPDTVKEWYELFARSNVLGLFYLNAFDIITFALLGIVFAAVCKRLSSENKSLIFIALPFAFLGIGVFIVPRTMLIVLQGLSTEFAAAATAAEAGALIAAGKVLGYLAVPSIETTGFFITAFAAFLVSLAALASYRMPKISGFIGVMAFFLTVAENICAAAVPALAQPLLIVAGAFWIIWLMFIGVGLIKAKD